MAELKVSDYLVKNYDGYYEQGDSEWHRIIAIDKAENIISLSKKYAHDSIIEIGVGEGSILKRLSDLGFGKKLYGLEISASGIEATQKKKIESLVECKVFDGYNIPYEDNKFDLAVFSTVVEHLEYPRRLIYEASRIAKYIFVEVELLDTIRLSRDFVFDRAGRINFYSPKTIRRLIQTCGLEVLEQKTTNPSLKVHSYRLGKKARIIYLFKNALLKTLPRFAPIVFTYHSSLICRKKSRCNGTDIAKS